MTGAGPAVVYGLCLLTSAICAAMLMRAYPFGSDEARVSLLALNNLMVVLDMVVLPHVDFTLPRQLTSLAAVCVLLYGFIWEIDQ